MRRSDNGTRWVPWTLSYVEYPDGGSCPQVGKVLQSFDPTAYNSSESDQAAAMISESGA